MKPELAPQFRSVSIFATGQHTCAYLPDRTARTLFVDPREPLDTAGYATLVDQGFRRSGAYVYRPGCPSCRACLSLRIPVREFSPRRRHRRCIAHNADLIVTPVAPRFDAAQYELYCRYINSRHVGSQMANPSVRQFLDFLRADWCETRFYEFRRADGELLAVSVIDELRQGLSAVYTFYEPKLSERSLGTYAILWQIAEARRRGLDYVYLGYWIADCDKMRYKRDFLPHEVYRDGAWERVDSDGS